MVSKALRRLAKPLCLYIKKRVPLFDNMTFFHENFADNPTTRRINFSNGSGRLKTTTHSDSLINLGSKGPDQGAAKQELSKAKSTLMTSGDLALHRQNFPPKFAAGEGEALLLISLFRSVSVKVCLLLGIQSEITTLLLNQLLMGSFLHQRSRIHHQNAIS